MSQFTHTGFPALPAERSQKPPHSQQQYTQHHSPIKEPVPPEEMADSRAEAGNIKMSLKILAVPGNNKVLKRKKEKETLH